MEIFAFTLDLVGKLLIAFTAIMVHHRVQQEHKIDAEVFQEMKKEKWLGIIGIVLMVLGYLVHVADWLALYSF